MLMSVLGLLGFENRNENGRRIPDIGLGVINLPEFGFSKFLFCTSISATSSIALILQRLSDSGIKFSLASIKDVIISLKITDVNMGAI